MEKLMPRLCRFAMLAAVAACLLWTASPALAQTGTKNGEWRSYAGDLGSTRYAPLDQINAGNFNQLEVAWRFKTDSLGPRPEFQYEGTPLFVHGTLFVTAGTRRAVVALDGKTGEMLWMHSENEGKRAENYLAMESHIGPTAAKNASSTSRQVIAWLLWMPRPASLCRPSGIRA
jgi:glucose dehydrogenase